MNYLSEKPKYHSNGEFQAEDGRWIMLEWEREIMEESAKVICQNGGDILNVGFGMGIIDSYIQTHNPRTHWIIEGHPTVQKKIIEDGWLKKPNVKVIFKPWQEVYDYLPKFDGIYFDTWDENQSDFDLNMDLMLKPKGIYSFFNNPSREKRYWEEEGSYLCEQREWNLQRLNIDFKHFKIKADIPEGLHYWRHDLKDYHLPIVTLK
jgi:hypothetical protein